jgi:hypothetical protein
MMIQDGIAIIGALTGVARQVTLAGAQRVRRNLVFSAEAEEGSSHQIRHPMFLG